jgi:hypothetical protein
MVKTGILFLQKGRPHPAEGGDEGAEKRCYSFSF